MNLPMLAATTVLLHDEWWKQVSPSRNDFGWLFGTSGIIVVMALIWAVFIRKRENDGSSRYTYPHASDGARDSRAKTEAGSHRRRRRKRRRHRRNPTLAETGGLPPIRHEGMPDDPP